MMFDLPFAPSYHDAVKAAVDHAHRLGHPYAGTEHLLLGLLETSPELFRRAHPGARIGDIVIGLVEPGHAYEQRGELPYTPGAVRAFQSAAAAARDSGSDAIELRHLAAALVADDGIAGAALREAGIASPDQIG